MEEILYVERNEWEVLIRKEIQSGHSLCWIKEKVSYLAGKCFKKSQVSKFRRNSASQTLWRESALTTKKEEKQKSRQLCIYSLTVQKRTQMEKNGYTCMYVWLSPFAVHLKLLMYY